MNEHKPSEPLSPLKRALLAIQNLRARLETFEQSDKEPIAIIGMACRFPGGADTPQKFWELLSNGVDAVSEVPSNRWDIEAYYDPDYDVPGKMYTRSGTFIGDVSGFDAAFFGIAPREAASMDPQQRLLLEVSWEALERAGQAVDKLEGSDTGVFVGISSHDYGTALMHRPSGDISHIDAYMGTGGIACVAAGRVSYAFGFQGPNLALDTACSSSLVAVHLACHSLRAKESRLVLAGGVNLTLTPENTVYFSKLRALSPDGRCKAFDASANGFVRGEGCGIVVLKRLSDALADGDNVLAVIRGSAINQDGRSSGLTTPNSKAQQQVIRAALAKAGVEPHEVHYVEAHGTGTALGDPIEVRALAATLCEGRPKEEPLIIGSVKSNIGHLESAAGIAGLMKLVLSLQHEAIPANLHFNTPSPHIPWDEIPVKVPTTLMPWPSSHHRRVAGISSFGFSGTNAHLVLEEAPRHGAPTPREETPGELCHILPLSARSQEALEALAEAYCDYLSAPAQEGASSLQDICATTSVQRSHHDHRLAVVGRTREEFIAHLGAFRQGAFSPAIAMGRKEPGRGTKLAFVFSGQGSQWLGMGRDLLEQEPVFRQVIEEIDTLLRRETSWSLLQELSAAETAARLEATEIAQPAIFAVQMGLTALWRSWGVEPEAVVGHSVGEVAAATVAGGLSLEAAVQVVFHRGRVMQQATGLGKMVAVGLSPDEAQRCLEGYEGQLAVASINSPTSTVLSGDVDALAEVVASLQNRGVSCQELKVNYAFHSPHMDPCLAELVRALEGLRVGRASMPIVSTVTGRFSEEEAFDAAYWRRNVREPVRFAAAMEALLEEGVRLWLEIGPHPVLSQSMTKCLEYHGSEGTVLPSLRRGQDGRTVLLGSLGALYATGFPVDWARLYAKARPGVALPTYPFQRQRHWVEFPQGGPLGQAFLPGLAVHPLLGSRVHLAQRDVVFEGRWSATMHSSLDGHRFRGEVLVPAAVYLEMALAAACEAFGPGTHVLSDVVIQEALIIPDHDVRSVQLVLKLEDDERVSFDIFSLQNTNRETPDWTLHATGKLHVADDHEAHGNEQLEVLQARISEEWNVEGFYRLFAERGLEYGAEFQGIEKLWRLDRAILGKMCAPETVVVEIEEYRFHPTLLDMCVQLIVGPLLDDGAQAGEEASYLPARLEALRLYRPLTATMWGHAVLRREGASAGDTAVGDLCLFDEHGYVVAEFKGMAFKRVSRSATLRIAQRTATDWLYEIEWKPQPRSGETSLAASAGRSWLIFADGNGIGSKLARLLEARGERVVEVFAGDTCGVSAEGQWEIDPAQPETFQRLLRETCGEEAPYGVVHLWSLDAHLPEDDTADDLYPGQLLGCGSALHLLQALTGTGWSVSPHLWLVTRGAQQVGAKVEHIEAAQAPLWGLGSVITLEYPALHCVRVDLDPVDEIDGANVLFEELQSPETEDQVAFRAGQRYVARLVPSRRSLASAPVGSAMGSKMLRADGTYLITGGLGGLGLAVAQWMVEQGARHLVLLGRREASAAVRDAVQALEKAGAEVVVAQADVRHRDRLAQVLAEVQASMPPLRGVVHAAGLLDDGLLRQQSWERFAAVMAPKVEGAWNLHVLTRTAPLDFFTLFSSAVVLLGLAGQGNYAAANAFMDGLAHYRRAQGRCALSINWGPWGEIGMAARLGDVRTQQTISQSLGRISPGQGVEIFGHLLGTDAAHVSVLSVHWSTFLAHLPLDRAPALLADLPRQTRSASGRQGPDKTPSARPEIVRTLEQAPAHRRQEMLVEYLQEQAARVLGLDPSKPLDPHQPLEELGLDSLMAVELSNALARMVGQALPATLLFDYPTLEALSGYLVRQLRIDGMAPQAVQVAVHSPAGADEPIAVIGMACRFPGRADDAEAFWELLRRGYDAISEVPADRWDIDAYYDPDPDVPGKMYTRFGAFVDDIAGFDASFFGISTREAASMDPQQRWLLEVSWEALEHAGQSVDELVGSETGVFVGVMTNDYSVVHMTSGVQRLDGFSLTGHLANVASGRLAYALGLQGPTMSVDTACSSSLVAIHLACESLRSGGCNLALACGVNIILRPEGMIGMCKLRGLAPDGRCKTFDARADGYVRGEGCGVVVLKRLSEAMADGDNILAVVRGSAVNQDGRSSGLTAPNGPAQEKVIRKALERAGVSSGQVKYVEAHGTGTPLGDPIEVQALATVFCDGRSKDEPLIIGSVKTNFGHLEGAAGIAGFIKVILSLQHEQIPAHLNFKEPSPYIPWDAIAIKVPTTLTPWPSGKGQRVAGISSFGFSGTNAHVVVEEAPRRLEEVPSGDSKAALPQILSLSARNLGALEALAESYSAYLTAEGMVASAAVRDIAYTASIRRSHQEYRLAVVGRTHAELAERLREFRHGQLSQTVTAGQKIPGNRPRIAFVYSGQGSQLLDTGRALLEQEPVFREVVEQCDALLSRHGGWSLLDVLVDETESRLSDNEEIIQPAMFAIQMALTALWRSWGIEPDAVVGISRGEVAAAAAAGALSLEDAVRVIFHRGRVQQQVTGKGIMVAVELSLDEVKRRLQGYEDRVSVAAVNSPISTILSGEAAALEEIVQSLEEAGVFCKALNVQYASHSPQMEPLQGELIASLRGIRGRRPDVPIVSTVTGRLSQEGDFNADYWGLNIREPVQFDAAVDVLLNQGTTLWLELGPHPTMAQALTTCLRHRKKEGTVLGSLRSGEDERSMMLGSLGALYTQGYPVEWRRIYPGGRCIHLPRYPFQHKPYWLESKSQPDAAVQALPVGSAVHPLLGSRVRSASQPWVFESRWHVDAHPLSEPNIAPGLRAIPAALYAEMARAAAMMANKSAQYLVRDLVVHEPIVVSRDEDRVVQCILNTANGAYDSFEIFSLEDAADTDEPIWTLHVTGTVHAYQDRTPPAGDALAAAQSRCTQEQSIDAFYQNLRRRGLPVGGDMQMIEQLWSGDNEVVGKIRLPDASASGGDEDRMPLIALHAGLQLFESLLAATAGRSTNTPMHLVRGFDVYHYYRRPDATLWGHAVLRPDAASDGHALMGDLCLFNETGDMIAKIEGLRLEGVPLKTLLGWSLKDKRRWLYQIDWQRQTPSHTPSTASDSGGSWLIMADGSGVGAELGRALEARGAHAVLVVPGQATRWNSHGHWEIDPANPEDFQQLLHDAFGKDDPLCRGIIHLWSLDAAPEEATTTASLDHDQLLSCGGALHVLQALVNAGWTHTPRVWLVTRGAQAVESAAPPLAVAQTPLWALGKVFALEHPMLFGGMVDLDPDPLTNDVAQLLQEILSSTRDDHVAYRKGQRHVARLVRSRVRLMAGEHEGFRNNATYLIPGGLGGLGLHLAQWMVERGARHLVLMGRSDASAEVQEIITRMEQAGAEVVVARGDVSKADDVARVLQHITQTMPPLRGLFYAAGIFDDGVLLQQTWARFANVMSPKIAGAWNLHALTHNLPLDYFVLFSSAVALFGNYGQGNYAAANGFLDGLAHYRRSKGLPALSVNWGQWNGVGMASSIEMRRREDVLANRGVATVPADRGFGVLRLLLAGASPQVGVVPIHWPLFFADTPSGGEPALLTKLAREVQEQEGSDETIQQGETILARFHTAPSDQQQQIMEDYLRQRFAKTMGMEDNEIPVDRSIQELGLDSVMLVEVINAVSRDLKLALYPREFYERPMIGAVAKYLVAELQRDLSESTEFEPAPDRSEGLGIAVWENTRPVPAVDRRIPGIVFLLSSPRSGSTLLRVMLEGHSSLFAPPELHLLPFDTMKQRHEALTGSYLEEGLQRAIMEIRSLGAAESKAVLDSWTEQELSIQEVYGLMQEMAGDRWLVDKSPTYGGSLNTLRRAEALFEGAKYIHLVRHPYAMIESFVRMRLHRLLGTVQGNPYELAEEVWATSNQNILDFFEGIDAQRHHLVHYEDLVSQPEQIMRDICVFLEIPFEETLLQPYEGERMTSGVYENSLPVSDPNFLSHRTIDPQLGKVWRNINLPHRLGVSAQRVASLLHYELPQEAKTVVPVPSRPLQPPDQLVDELYLDIRGIRQCVCISGPQDGPVILCIHGILDHGAAWEAVTAPLVQLGYRVVAPDLRGHGCSGHVAKGAAYYGLDFVADIDAIIRELSNEPFVLVGHSMGAALAAMFTSARQELVRALVLVEPLVPAEPTDIDMVDRLTTHLNYIASTMKHPVFPDIRSAAELLRQQTPTMSADMAIRMARRITEPVASGVRWRWDPLLRTRTGIGFDSGFERKKYLGMINRIDVPMMLVFGDNSNFSRSEDQAQLLAAAKQAIRVDLHGGHNLHVDAAADLASHIVKMASVHP